MYRILLWFSFSLLLFSDTFKIASYNVQNLFDTHYDGREYPSYNPQLNPRWNDKVLEIKLNHIAQVICDLDADILGVQEVENTHAFNLLIQKLTQVGCGYDYHTITTKKNAVIQVGLLSRYPIAKRKEIVVSHLDFVRNILQVRVRVAEHDLTLFVNHWKSMAYKGVESKRIAYAKALQRAIKALDSAEEYVILGDMNADYNASAKLPKRLDDTEGLNAFSDILQTKMHGKLLTNKEMQTPQRGKHCSLWYEVPLPKRWSYRSYKHKSSLDHIVLPTQMFDHRGIDYLEGSFDVFRLKYLLTPKGYIRRWKYKKGRPRGYSDHLPIFASFVITHNTKASEK